jgi:hypothetical protein
MGWLRSSLLGILMIVLPLPAAAFDNHRTIWIGDKGQPIHETITRQALPFLQPIILDQVVSGNVNVDRNTLVMSSAHFDNCAIVQSIERINSGYDNLLVRKEMAPQDFGALLHTAQDFYAHTNWVESGNYKIVDSGAGRWAARPNVYSGISEWSIPKFCPIRTPSHDDLNKDTLDRANFQKAFDLALLQTKHEWCRLLNLLRANVGKQGFDDFLMKWAVDSKAAVAACPNIDVVIIIDSSSRMTAIDPTNSRLHAAISYLKASLPGDYVGIVAFDSSPRILSELKQLPENIMALDIAINSIKSNGVSNIGAGIQAGCDVLNVFTTGNFQKIGILIGHSRGTLLSQHSCFLLQGWPIYTFGFGGSDNDKMLRQIAASTGGYYRRLPSMFGCEFMRIEVRSKMPGYIPHTCPTSVIPSAPVALP